MVAKKMKIYTVGSLVKALEESGCPPDTPVWAVGMHARPITSLMITTAADPATGRLSDGPPVVVIK